MKINRSLMLYLGGMMLAAGMLNGAQLTIRRFPAIVSTDGPTFVTSILLRLPMKTYSEGGTPLDTLLNDTNLDARERAMVTYLNSIRTANANTFHALEYVPPPNVKHVSSFTMGKLSFDQSVAAWKKVFDNFRNVRLECQIPTETGDLFIWKAETAEGWVRSGFLVLLVEGKPRVDFAGSDYPIEVLIVQSLDRRTIDSVERMAVQPSERREFTLELDGRGSALEFNGEYLNTKACDLAGPVPPAVRVLCTASTKLREGDRDGYLALLWSQSRKSMEEWFQQYGFQAWRNRQFEHEYIRFILDADPVFIVFLTRTGGSTWPDGALYHRYVFRDSGGLHLGNVYI
ncbi:MAG: hypothetical protein ABSG25_07450, partial [Bryobacteraceae bacterium]